jgi:flagellar basal-body rod protein FlgG
MLYGLYASATGVMTNSYRQDVIANNLANSETNGFKKDLAMFRQRPTAAEEDPSRRNWSDPLLEKLGGGIFAEPTQLDMRQGPLEVTGNTTDAAIDGSGFFVVADHDQKRLTRNGQFLLDKDGNLITAGGRNLKVLDADGNPIKLDSKLIGSTTIGPDGSIKQGDNLKAKLAVVDVPDPAKLANEGGTMLSYPDMTQLQPAAGVVRGQTVENANVNPATELTSLMEAQRELEANANMIHYQDETLDKLVNTVGRIS